MKRKRLYYMDYIRILAAICVITCHYTANLQYCGIQSNIEVIPMYIFGVYLGSFGVSLFFIVSGAALMYVYDEKCEIKQYIKKRVLSIYPMFWIAYFIAFLYFFYINGGLSQTPKWRMLWTFLGVDGYVAYFQTNFYILGEWFLGCLICLYILFPLLRWGIRKKPVVAAIIIIVVFAVSLMRFNTALPTSLFFLVRVPEFAFGMYFVKFRKEVRKPELIIAVAILCVGGFLTDKGVDQSIMNGVIGIAAFILLTFIFQNINIEWLNNFAAKYSKYTYALFLAHHVILRQVLEHYPSKVLGRTETYILYLLCVAAMGIGALMLYKIHEKIMSSISSIRKVHP